MSVRAYKLTGRVMAVAKRLIGLRMRVSGTEHLVDRPTLFVANHFTRIETFLIPYVIWDVATRPVRSLGTHAVFRGLFGKYFRSIGGMSTRDPRRNRTIIRELITGRHDWVIYPEGGLIKNKKTVHRGRLRLEHPDRHGPPHTGAAMLALKAEMCKQRYLEACETDDMRRIEYYDDAFGIRNLDEICRHGIVMTPVTMAFYPMRPSRNIVNRLAKFFFHDLDPRIDEELQVEGSILFRDCEMCVRFGEPIEVAEYLGKVTELARKVVGVFSEAGRSDLFLRKQATKLTGACMRSIYGNTEVNFDHLFCYALRVLGEDRISAAAFHRMLFLAISSLREAGDVRLHPSLRDGVMALVAGEAFKPLELAIELAKRNKILRVDNGDYVVDRARVHKTYDFHKIRLKNMVQVIGNELEPIEPAVEAVERSVKLPPDVLRTRTGEALQRRDVTLYERDYDAVKNGKPLRPREMGEPFLLDAKDKTLGVVLVHGYLASPEQVRPMAKFLNGKDCQVYAVRLKGHGTSPEQLTEVRWEEWLKSVERGYAVMRQHCEQVVVGGLSLGGILALLIAADRAKGLGGVFSINAPMVLRDRRAPFVPALLRFNGAMRKLGLADGHYRRLNDDSESPEINYGTDYLLGVQELRVAVDRCRKNLGAIEAPTLIVQSDGDPLVAPNGARKILDRVGAEDKKLVELSHDRHVIVRGTGSEIVFAAVWQFVARLRAQRAQVTE